MTATERMFNTKLVTSINNLAHAIRESHSNEAVLQRIGELERKIMASQTELAADLRTANTQLRKLVADTAGIQPSVDALTAKVAELEALVAAGGTIGQELIDAVAETKALTQAVDDNVPELVQAPTP